MAKLILVIDDDPDFAEAVTSLLEADGYEVEYAENGAVGYEKATARKPDLILLDVMMTTKTEGFELSRKLKNDPATNDVPVVLVTGIRRDMNIPYSFEPDSEWLPVRAVVEKPIRPEALLRTVSEQIR